MNGTDFKPTKVNPHFLMLYGHIMACGKSYQSAIGEMISLSGALLRVSNVHDSPSLLLESLRSLPK